MIRANPEPTPAPARPLVAWEFRAGVWTRAEAVTTS